MTKIEKVLDVLNTAYEADPAAIHCLCSNSIPCNEALLNHPVVPVMGYGGISVDALGLVNGIIFALTGSMVKLKWAENPEKPNGAKKLVGFEEVDSSKENSLPKMPEKYAS